MVSIYNSISLITYVYKIHELQNFLKTLKFNNNISYVYVDNSNFITVLKN